MSKVTRTTLAIGRKLLGEFDRWMAQRGYANRSEAVRDLIRSALVAAEWEDPGARVVATLSIIYEHERRELAQQLTELQHAQHHAILCSQHVHLDHQNCLEVIIMQGTARQLRRITDAISATKGVKAGKLTLLSRKI